jgi:hypothetical protein
MAAAAAIADLLEHLPTLTRKQASTVAVAAEPPDGDYTITLVDALGEAEGSSSTATELRDDLLGDVAGTAVAVAAALGTRSLTLTGKAWGVAFDVAVAGPEADAIVLTTITAAGVPQPVLERYLGIARRLVANTELWAELLTDAQALRALHLLARTGTLARYGVNDPGEVGQTSSRSLGPSSASFATTAPSGDPNAADERSLSSTRWGRAYWEIWIAVRPKTGGLVLR